MKPSIFILMGMITMLNMSSAQKINRSHSSALNKDNEALKLSKDHMVNIMANPISKTKKFPSNTKFNNCGQYVLSREQINQTQRTGEFIVNYTGFSTEAMTAFQHAVDIWSRYITTTVPITIEASFDPLGSGILGSAGPTYINLNFTNAPFSDTWYPIGLVDQFTRQDEVGVDISASFSSNFSNWYFGLDGCPGSGEYDFVTVVMHEIAHGLGFFANADAFYYPFAPYTGLYGCYGFEFNSTYYPIVFERFLQNGSGIKVTDFDPDFCWRELYNMFTGDDLFLNSPSMNSCLGSTAKMYAPFFFSRGSSISHFDEYSYPDGSLQALMTPFVSAGEAVHQPGCTLALLTDMGYQTHDLILQVPQTSIPTLSRWGLICMAQIFLIIGLSSIKSRESQLQNQTEEV